MDGGMINTARPLLTEAELVEWRERRAELGARIMAAQAEFERVDRCIDLAEQLIALKNGQSKPMEAEVETASEAEDDETPQVSSSALIRAAIEDAFTTGLRHKKAPEIRERIRRDARVRAILDATPNAYYSVMYRMVKTAKLVRTRRGYRLPEPTALEKQLEGSGFLVDIPDPSESNPASEPQPRS